jgi:hypothetical protein
MDRHMLRHLPKELADDILADSDAFEVLADGRKVLKPGRSFRTPMRAMDAKTVIGNADTVPKLADGLPAQAHRSHWGMSRKRDLSCYDSYDKEISQAYLQDDYGAQSRGSQPGDLCTCRGPEYPWAFGSPGHLDENLVCVPDSDPRASDARPKNAKAIRDEAYAAYEKDLTSAWKKGPDEQTHSNNPRPAARSVVVNDSREKAIADYNNEIENAWRNGK